MKLVALVGSGKLDGNTEQLTDAFLKGAAEGGHEVQKLHLGRLTVAPCRGCGVCKAGGGCVQKDDMKEIISAFYWSDAVVFATPLYFWGISSQLKAVIDRLYAIGTEDPRGYYRYPYKKTVLLATAADTEKHFWVFELVENYYRRLVKYMRWTDLGILTAGSCGGTKEERCIQATEHLERAYHFGKQLK